MSKIPDSELPNVIQAIAAVMDEVQKVGKTGKNQAQNYSFRGVDAVVNAVGPVLREHRVVVVPVKSTAEYRDVLVGKNQTPQRECTLTVRFRFYGPAGDHVEAEVCSEALDSGDKATSKAHSVAYRTCLVEALSIPTGDPDPDESSPERAKAEPAPIDPTEMLRRDLGKVAKDEGLGPELAGALLVEKFGEGTTSKSLNIDQLRGAAAAFKRYGNQRRKVELLRNQLELTEEGLLATAATILELEADGVKSLDDLVMHEVDALVVDLELRTALGKDMLPEGAKA